MSLYDYSEIKYELHTSLTRQVNIIEEYCIYVNIRWEFVPNSLFENLARGRGVVTLPSHTKLNMFHWGILLKTEDCGGSHLILG